MQHMRIEKISDIIVVPKEVENGTEKIFEEKMTKYFSILMKAITLRNPMNST